MARKKSCHLVNMLAELTDPRKEKGKRHPLKAILALLVVGLMCGHKGYTSIATWARSQPALTKALGFTHHKTPCAATIHNLLKKLDVEALENILSKWVNAALAECPDLRGCSDAVAIDGKTLRASKKSGAMISHLLSVVSHELGITLTQRGVSDKTNEIPISTEILKAFDVAGKVITTDALLTQRSFCHGIINSGGDYMLPVKNNQPDLLEAIEKLFQDVPDAVSEDTTHPTLGKPIYMHETIEKSHGRLETRCIKASTSLNAYLDWPGIAQVIQYHYTSKNMKTGEETTRTTYGITSLKPHLPPFLYAVCVGVCVYRNKLESLMGYGRIPPYKIMSVKNRQGGILMKYTLSWVHPRKIITGFRKVFNGVCIKKPTLRNFYLMLQAVCVAPSFRIQSIASHLPIRVKHDKSKQKRVLRFIDTYFPVAAVKGAWLSHIVVSVCRSVGMQHLLVLIDETDLPGGWKAIVAALPFRNRAIPLYWVLYKNEMLKDGTYQGHNDLVQQFCCDVHSRVVKVLGDSREPVLVFDRGFARARAILKFFEGQGICYLIRVPRNVGVRIAGNKQCLEEVANGFYPQVLYHYTEQVPVALYVGGQHTKKDPLYLISNRLQGNPLRTCYKRRTQIEHGFRDLKTNFGFKALVLRKNEQPRMEVLFLLAVVAYGLAFLCYEKAADRWAKTLHPTRKVYSVISVINRMIREVWTQEALLLFTERTCLRDINFLTAEELT